jgi:CheY-like chemotaxis protein
LRLKQILLNLGRNATKFVEEGFIRFRAAVVNGSVQLYVEDSGQGIPEEKRHQLFGKFQESLDSLSQGTGIGLCLCKTLVDLMGGELWIDDAYDSGVEGCPGTRFVIDLHVPPLKLDDSALDMLVASDRTGGDTEKTEDDSEQELPEELNVLFVDDDLILRKLFVRAVKKAAPKWRILEASNGETALRLVETEQFDLIFMDQYMASVQKQLLGTEAVRAMRAKGVQCRICGLSANDVEESFREAGANAFMFKPFPFGYALKQELFRVLYEQEEPRLVTLSNTAEND